MERTKITWEILHTDCKYIASNIVEDTSVNIDLVIGLLRGGTIPATILSHMLNKPMIAIGVRSYQGTKKTNTFDVYQDAIDEILNMSSSRKLNVLIVDDLSDTGDTLNHVMSTYADLFNKMLTATPYIKLGTKHIPHYYSFTFAKEVWLDFPWEN